MKLKTSFYTLHPNAHSEALLGVCVFGALPSVAAGVLVGLVNRLPTSLRIAARVCFFVFALSVLALALMLNYGYPVGVSVPGALISLFGLFVAWSIMTTIFPGPR